MDKVFKVEITNGEPNGYLSATFLDLPASENEYIQAQVQAKVANSEKMETEVLQVYQGPVTTDMVDGALFSELNTLAAVLSQLDDTQAFALEGMLKIRQEATGTQKIAISDILHMADNTDRCMVAMDGKNRELSPEEETAELAKPGSHPEWETNLPAAIQKDIDAYLESIRTQVTYLDCLWDELYGSINANQWGWEISKEQADYLRAKYLFEPEDEAEDFHQTQS